MRLNNANLGRVDAKVRRPRYDRSRTVAGVVHLGPGAFHRAHQAVYADTALEHCEQLAICAVSLRSARVRDALLPQDGLYTLAIVDREPGFRVIGAVRDLLVAVENPPAVIDRLADPAVHTVTLTVTEKGYCLGADANLDTANGDIAHDLRSADRPRSAIGFLVAALRARRDAGTPPFVIVRCDNLRDNGGALRRALRQFSRELDVSLSEWIDDTVRCPATMVDSITPATDDSIRSAVESAIGMTDAWPVQRERFAQWVVEDGVLPLQAAWAAAGVTFSNGIGAFETAKLRILNGQHSALAYLGILSGYRTVMDAIGDEHLRNFLAELSATEIQPSVQAPAGLDLGRYSTDVIRRFENPMIEHRVEQIAIDGSQKIPIRILATLRDNLAAGRPIRCLCLVLAAWLNFLDTRASDGSDLDDPLADTLLAAWRLLLADTASGLRTFLGLEEVFGSDLSGNATLLRELQPACELLRGTRGPAVGERIRHYLG